ncbi:MAG: sugar phosphate nucleotidyltransferase [Actinobacteria bacterium]|nr:sugar phosphate nucleotidyltransferase [Actinomycetota bacterium]
MLYAVILAGGSGTRFWPKSRASLPKQFLRTTGPLTLLQATVRRIEPLVPPDNILVVAGRAYAGHVSSQLPQLPRRNFLIEPERRETVACIGLAAAHLDRRDPGATMIVLPSDHHITGAKLFLDTLETAAEVARSQGGLVTLGIRPTRPETGYGYINIGGPMVTASGNAFYGVKEFTEKPSRNRALAFLRKGTYLWNSGMFVWQVSAILESYERLLPETYHTLRIIQEAIGTPEETDVLEANYREIHKVSIDYGIMERAQNVYVVPAEFGWDDVGSWGSLARVLPRDTGGNVTVGETVTLDTRNCIIDSGKHLVATVGVKDLIIVATGDAVLVCHRKEDQQIKNILEKLKGSGHEKYL